MNRDDESELARLSNLLSRIDNLLPQDAPEREALANSGFPLIQEFLRGNRWQCAGVCHGPQIISRAKRPKALL
jgi:hypothetical protein